MEIFSITVYACHIVLGECLRKNEESRYRKTKNPENRFPILLLAAHKITSPIQYPCRLNQRF